MFPIIFEYKEYVLASWHLLFCISILAAYFLYAFLYRNYYPHIKEKYIKEFFLICYLSGYFGARIFSIFVDQKIFSISKVFSELFLLGPMTFLGGALASFITGGLYIKTRNQNLMQYLDLAIPSCLLGLFFGRIGCFLNGDDYGKEVVFSQTKPWWAVVFPNHDLLVPRYPVQIIESFFSLLICFYLLFYLKKNMNHLKSGYCGLLGILLYSVIRFFIEFFRGDPRGWIIENTISTSQGISIILFSISLFFVFYLNSLNKSYPKD